LFFPLEKGLKLQLKTDKKQISDPETKEGMMAGLNLTEGLGLN
jgi:hypothetical protein